MVGTAEGQGKVGFLVGTWRSPHSGVTFVGLEVNSWIIKTGGQRRSDHRARGAIQQHDKFMLILILT